MLVGSIVVFTIARVILKIAQAILKTVQCTGYARDVRYKHVKQRSLGQYGISTRAIQLDPSDSNWIALVYIPYCPRTVV